MKNSHLILVSLSCLLGMPADLFGQDIITKTDSSTIAAQILEINETSVRYKKWDRQSGPTYVVGISDILFITYPDGSKDVFQKQAPAAEEPALGQTSESTKEMNDKAVSYAASRSLFAFRGKKAGKKSKLIYGVFSPRPGTAYMNDDVSLEFASCEIINMTKYGQPLKYYTNFASEGVGDMLQDFGLMIKVTNNTDNTLFIDLGNTFIIKNSMSEVFYVPSASTKMESNSGGMSVNLGGVTDLMGVGGAVGAAAHAVNVGGGKTKSTTTTTFSQRVLALPPHSTKMLDTHGTGIILPRREYGCGPSNYITLSIPTPTLVQGQVVTYSYSDTPYKLSTFITYSDSETLEKTASISTDFYVSKLGGGDWSGLYNGPQVSDWDMDSGVMLFFGCEDFLRGEPDDAAASFMSIR